MGCGSVHALLTFVDHGVTIPGGLVHPCEGASGDLACGGGGLTETLCRSTNLGGPMAAPTHPVEITDAEFQQKIKEFDNVVVDAWAPWCGPCKRIAPIIDELATEYGGKVAFLKLNTDENQATAMKYGIMSIPTLMMFKGGQRVDQVVGLVPKDALKARLDKTFGTGA